MHEKVSTGQRIRVGQEDKGEQCCNREGEGEKMQHIQSTAENLAQQSWY